MKSSTLLVSGIYHGVPGDIYDGSSDEITIPPSRGSAYYLGPTSGSQTIGLSLVNFQGTIEFFGTLDTNPKDATWSLIYEFGDGSARITENLAVNVKGNYTWVKAEVKNFTHGVINEIRINH